MVLLITAIDKFATIIMILLVARALCSWFAKPGGIAYTVYKGLSVLTEPIVAPCRKITSRINSGVLDLSVILAFLLVMLVRDLLIRIITLFM